MSIQVNYGQASGRLFPIPPAHGDDRVTVIFRRGSRDDDRIGSSHTMEHILVAQSQEALRHWGDITGYTTHDITMISFRLYDSTEESFLKVNAWLQLCFDTEEVCTLQHFKTARAQITQELTLQAHDLKASVSNLPVQSLWHLGGMGRPIDSLDSSLTFEEFVGDVKDWAQRQFSIFCPERFTEQLGSQFGDTMVRDESNSLLTDPPAPYEPRDLRVTWPGLSNTFVQSLGLGKPHVTHRDIFYLGIVSAIWQTRLEATLRPMGSYVNLSFPKIHRGETAIFLVFSGPVSAVKNINAKIANLLQILVTEEEMKRTTQFLARDARSTNRKWIHELDAMFQSDIFDGDMTSLSATITEVNEWIARLPLENPGTVLWS